MPIRNPFARRSGNLAVQDENVRPGSSGALSPIDPAHPGFERVNTVGSSKASSALSIRSTKSQDNGEYKMSVVNDSGVYLPPSPSEKEAAWPRRYLSRSSTETRSGSDFAEIEHFSISRESFDSYRRSFDICAKSPVVITDVVPPRQSLDSRFPRLPRSSFNERRFEREPPTPEEGFEEVGLNEEPRDGTSTKQAPVQRKRGFFKFGTDHTTDAASVTNVPSSVTAMSRFLPGRKRGQSGQGAELDAMPITTADKPGIAITAVQGQEVQA